MRHLVSFRDINVHASSAYYAFSSPSSPSAQTLVVDRPSGDLSLSDQRKLGTKRVSSIAGLLGMIKLRLDKYIIVITKAQPMGRLKGHTIYKVTATEFLPLRERALHDPDEDTYLSLLKTFLKNSPMYFSYSIDLTSSFQRQSQSEPSLPLWQRTDDRFFFNKFLQSDLIQLAVGGHPSSAMRSGPQPGADPFILPVMFGMMRIAQVHVKSQPFTFALLTRRSRHRTGTRYLTRGLDEEGHVANYNETEQIVILNDNAASGGYGGAVARGGDGQETQVMSFVQTRGSVPVYWAEVNTLHYTPNLQVRSADLAMNAARLHFEEQIKLYGDNYLINLVNQKGREDHVKRAYEQIVRIMVSAPQEDSSSDPKSSERIHIVESSRAKGLLDNLHYVYFDFHNETKGLKWHRAQLLLDQLIEPLTRGQYFRGIDMPADPQGRLEVRNKQTAVMRTNCMDCLDRTNVIQTMLARWTLTRQLTDVGILGTGESAADDAQFENLFRNVWADNADTVSKAYSGTGALKTDFTRTGKRTKAGALQDLNNSISRYFKNNFRDGPRQDAFDLFSGAYIPPPAGTALIFVDKRPLFIQAVPYLLAGCSLFVLIAGVTRTGPDTTVWPLRLVAFICMLVAAWCGHFMWTHGMLYVNWPKLNTPRWAIEGYQSAVGRAVQDPLIGGLIFKHDRGLSNVRVASLEEGKKRIQ